MNWIKKKLINWMFTDSNLIDEIINDTGYKSKVQSEIIQSVNFIFKPKKANDYHYNNEMILIINENIKKRCDLLSKDLKDQIVYETAKFVQSEEFIDEIVMRIKRKQLQ